MYVIGTAGHVDHGKTLLIEALTGIDTDRLPEEKRRGLTIDLGFAHFAAPDGAAVGVIDVPGHERFIRNMVAGAWSLSCGLLVVAADDGWMRQSSDHTRVLRAMDVPKLILVVTKTDLAAEERVEAVIDHGLEQCGRLGYPDAPAVAVSAATGANIETLRETILRQLAAIPDPPPDRPFLYIDRVFSVQGAGVVVTGSLVGGELRRDTELELLPERRRVRVRSIQAYYRGLEAVKPTCRVALNLAGVKHEAIRRGHALSVPGAPMWAERELIARLSPAESLESLRRTIRKHGEAEIAAGTGHYRARLHPLGAPDLVRIVATERIPLRWNEPVVFIRHGGSEILGAARILWPGAANREERRRLIAAFGSAEPEGDQGPFSATALPSRGSLELAMHGYRRSSTREASGPRAGDARAPGLSALGEPIRRGDWLFLPDTLEELERGILSLAHAPGGLPVSELASRFGMDVDMLRALCTELVERGSLVLRSGVLLPVGAAESSLSPMGRQLLTELRGAGAAGLQLDRLRAAGTGKEMRTLGRAGLAVSLDGNIFYARETYDQLARRILAERAPGQRFSIAAAKERSGLSRKYIIPFLNRMEDEGLVRREGDEREVLRLPEGASDARTSETPEE